MIRVWIETASHVARAGLRALLEREPGIEIANLREEGEVVVMDALLPLELAGESVPVVLLSSEPLSRQTFRNGVRAVLPPDAESAQIAAAVQAVAAGLIAAPWNAAPLLASGSTEVLDNEPLTRRELEVLEMLAEGLSNKQIAGRLTISEHTAKFHVNSILGKLGAGTRTEAVTRGIRAGILKI